MKALFTAIKDNNFTKVKNLITEENINDMYLQNTPLMYAIKHHVTGKLSIIRYLIKQGADINQKSKYGFTALMFAVIYGQEDIVEFLIKKGALIEDTDNSKRTALQMAFERKYLNIVHYLLKKGADIKPVKNDIQNDMWNRCDTDEDINIWTRMLFVGCNYGDLEMLEELLPQKECHINQYTEYGETALLIATYRGYTEVVELLLKYGADVHAQDSNTKRRTPFLVASRMGHFELVLLLSYASDIHALDDTGKNALILAVVNGHIEIVRLLLGKGIEQIIKINVTTRHYLSLL